MGLIPALNPRLASLVDQQKMSLMDELMDHRHGQNNVDVTQGKSEGIQTLSPFGNTVMGYTIPFPQPHNGAFRQWITPSPSERSAGF